MALSRFRQAKSANEEAKNKWLYGIFEQWQKQRFIKGCQVVLQTSRFANFQFANNRSRFANMLVLSLSSCSLATDVVGARDLRFKTGDHLERIRFHLVEIWINF